MKKSKTVEKALKILEELAQAKEDLTNSEIADRLGLHPSTSYRILSTLASADYVKKDGTSYWLGYKFLQLGGVGGSNKRLINNSRPFLAKLEDQTGFTTNLAVREGMEAIPIEIISGSRDLVVNTNLGKPVPLHASSVGKCLLAFSGREEKESLLGQLNLERYTPNTISEIENLEQELTMIREKGYAVDDEEFVSGIRCIGAPVFHHKEEKAIAAVSISGLSSQIPDQEIDELSQKVINVRDRIVANFAS